MSRLEELIAELCPDGVEYKTLGEICEISAGGDVPKDHWNKESNEQYYIPIYSNSIENDGLYGYTDSPKITRPAVTLSGRGAGCGNVILRKKPYFPIIRLITLVPRNNLLASFLYFYLQTVKFNIPKTGIPQFTVPMVSKYVIPIPPLEIQSEIVRILDTFNELKTELKAELKARKEQYEYYRDLAYQKVNAEIKTPLSELCDIGDGLHGTPIYDEDSDYYFINGNNLLNGKIIYTASTKTVFETEYNKYRKEFSENTLFMSINGTIGNIAIYQGEKIVLGKSAAYFKITSDLLDLRYLYHYLQTSMAKTYYENNATGSTIKNLGLKALRNFVIPLPPLKKQKEISKMLDMFDTISFNLTSGLPAEIAAREKQYEYYRDLLLTFKPKVTA